MGNASARSLIDHLHDDIGFTFAKSFPDSDASTIAQIFVDKLTGIDPKGFLQSILHTSSGMRIVIILMLFLFLIMYQFYIRPNAENLHTLWLKLLLTSNKKKGGNCEDTELS